MTRPIVGRPACLFAPVSLLLAALILAVGCGQEPGKKASPAAGAQNEPNSGQADSPGMVYQRELMEAANEDGTKSSFSYYFQVGSDRQRGENLSAAAEWVEKNGWPGDDTTTGSLLLKAYEATARDRELLQQGIEVGNPTLPRPIGVITPMPNLSALQDAIRLELAMSRRVLEQAEPSSAAAYAEAESTGLGLVAFGSHFTNENALLIMRLVGIAVMSHATEHLLWVLEQDEECHLKAESIANELASHEEATTAIYDAWVMDLEIIFDVIEQTAAGVLVEGWKEDPTILQNMRSYYEQTTGEPGGDLPAEYLAQAYDIQNLRRYYDEFIEVGEEFAALPIPERHAQYTDFVTRFNEAHPTRSAWLAMIGTPNLAEAQLREEVLLQQLRLAMTALAIRSAGDTLDPAAAVEQAGLPPRWAIDPFTQESFRTERLDDGRVRVAGVEPPPYGHGSKDNLHTVEFMLCD